MSRRFPSSRARRRAFGGRRKALTLVEIVFATALLVILLTGLFAALGSARKAEVWSREHQAASDAAFRTLEELAATPYGALTPGIAAFEVPYGEGGTTLPAADASFYPLQDDPDTADVDESTWAGRLIVREGPGLNDYDGDGTADVLELEAVVAWRGHDGSNNWVAASRLRNR